MEKVAVFVDYENIRMGLRGQYGVPADPARVAAVLTECVAEYGEMVLGNVYGDWSIPQEVDGRPVHTARIFEQAGFNSVMVTVKQSGQDRSDSKLLVDALEALLTFPDLGVFVIVSGDGDFSYLARKIRGAGKRLVICALTGSVSRELLSVASAFIPVEARLGIEEPPPRGEPAPHDWAALVDAVLAAEEKLPFVGYRHFRDNWLKPEMGLVRNELERTELLNEAAREGLVEVYKRENPYSHFDTAAIRARREHPLVTERTALRAAGAQAPRAEPDWERLASAVLEAEAKLPFVGYKHFRDRWLTPEMGSVRTEPERTELLNEAARLGIIEVYTRENPGSPFTTAALRANRENGIVRAVLAHGGAAEPSAPPEAPPDTPGNAPEL